MKNIQSILNAVLSKNIIEYILIDKHFTVIGSSKNIDKYLEEKLHIGDDILSVLPELVGAEDDIQKSFTESISSYTVGPVRKNDSYVNVSIEHYDQEQTLILLHNITDTIQAQQKLLQYGNESILLNNTLKNILDSQRTLLFATSKDEITYVNEQFMAYFGIEKASELKMKKLKIYEHLDHDLKDYDELHKRVIAKEKYVTINNDTFMLQASCIEPTHRLFTLTKVTKLTKDMQIDGLTGAYKKSYFNTHLERLTREQKEGVLVVLDIDNFKKVNDIYGHQTGDEILKEFAILIRNSIRENDLFARWGGEEFLLLLEDTSIDNAMTRVEQLRHMVDAHTFKDVGHITVSFGLAKNEKGDDMHSLLYRADQALYEAKNAGKNRLQFKELNS